MSGESKLAALRAAEIHKDSHWPGHPELPLKIRALSCGDVLACRAAAEQELKNRGVADTVLNSDAKEEETATQILFLALREPVEGRRPFAVDIVDLRENMSPEARAELIEQFAEHRRAADPWPSELSADVRASIRDAIKKKDRKFLRQLGSVVLATFLLTTDEPPST